MTAAVPEVKGRGAAAALAAAGALADTADGPQRQSHSGGAAASEKSAPADGQPAAASFYAVCTGIQQRVQAFLALQEATCSGVDQAALRRAQEHTRRSLEVIGQALGRYNNVDELALSYNGGKDCLVLLILYLAALPAHFASSRGAGAGGSALNHTGYANSPPSTTPQISSGLAVPSSFPSSLSAVYIEAPHPFAEVDSFVASSAQQYHLDLTRHDGALGLKAAFASYLALCPRVRAIFVGTRRTDPHGAALADFQATDRGWPAFMRVHPVLDWAYADIWTFLRTIQIPYCVLYDHGYTSLGGKLDTFPNPALRVESDAGMDQASDLAAAHAQTAYRPAYELLGDEAERWGRDTAS